MSHSSGRAINAAQCHAPIPSRTPRDPHSAGAASLWGALQRAVTGGWVKAQQWGSASVSSPRHPQPEVAAVAPGGGAGPFAAAQPHFAVRLRREAQRSSVRSQRAVRAVAERLRSKKGPRCCEKKTAGPPPHPRRPHPAAAHLRPAVPARAPRVLLPRLQLHAVRKREAGGERSPQPRHESGRPAPR